MPPGRAVFKGQPRPSHVEPWSTSPGRRKLHWLVPVAIVTLLILLELISYPAFHLLVELITIIIAINTFVVAWNTFPFSRNGYLLYVGLGYFWIAVIDLAHTLTYKGMQVLPVLTSNPPTQLWIGARYCEALLLLAAPLFLQRSFSRLPTFAVFGAVAVAVITAVAMGWFPDSYLEGSGLTPFKIASEYVISVLFLTALLHVRMRRELLDRDLLALLSAAITLKIFAELAFTLYVSVYGISNLVGHILKLFSFWLIYVALVEWSLTRPFLALTRGANTYDAVPDPTVVVDHEGYIRQANAAAREHAGSGHEGVLGHHVHTLFHTPALMRDRCPVCGAIAAGTSLRNAEMERPELGQWSEITLSPITRAGQYVGAIHVARDVTSRKQALLALEHTLQRLRESQEQTIRSEKLSALGTLSAGIAHEMNNPMMGIQNYVEYAEGHSTGKTRDVLGRARRELVRVQGILQNILAFARPAHLATGPVDAREALNRALQLTAAELRQANVEVVDEIPTELPTVCAKLDGLQQVFLNLIMNARDAMAESERRKLLLRATFDETTVTLMVADTGTGIDESIRRRIFDPFFTTKPPGVGTGLGLSVSLNLISGFGGTINCDSHPGEGTRFSITLNRCAAPPASTPPSDAPLP